MGKELRGVGIVVFAGQAGPGACEGSPMVGVPEDAIGIENRKATACGEWRMREPPHSPLLGDELVF
jgi:hypothetical protein